MYINILQIRTEAELIYLITNCIPYSAQKNIFFLFEKIQTLSKGEYTYINNKSNKFHVVLNMESSPMELNIFDNL